MSLRIVSQQQNLGLQLAKILLHYFKNPDIVSQTSSDQQTNKDSIHIDTKYFTCTIPLQLKTINSNNKNSSELTHEKVDMLIFTFSQQQQLQNIKQFIDNQISYYKPQVTTIVVNTNTNTTYPNEQLQQQWKYQSEIAECQNFVSVFYQNLGRIMGMWPKWTNSTLLQEEEQYMEIFGLFQMIQTTQWTNSIPKRNTVVNANKNISKTEPNTLVNKQLENLKQKQKENQDQLKVKVQTQSEIKDKPKIDSNKKQQESQKQQGDKRIKGQKVEECPEEVDQEQLQMEMREFQMMMQQMMQIKATPQSNQKKKRAEDFILNLAKKMDY